MLVARRQRDRRRRVRCVAARKRAATLTRDKVALAARQNVEPSSSHDAACKCSPERRVDPQGAGDFFRLWRVHWRPCCWPWLSAARHNHSNPTEFRSRMDRPNPVPCSVCCGLWNRDWAAVVAANWCSLSYRSTDHEKALAANGIRLNRERALGCDSRRPDVSVSNPTRILRLYGCTVRHVRSNRDDRLFLVARTMGVASS